jgi:uncharacterized protein YqeY
MLSKDSFQSDLKEAMRNKDELKKRVIRMVLAALKLAEVERRKEADEQMLFSILQKEVNTRKEMIEDATRAGRDQMREILEKEIDFLSEYLPDPLTSEEIEALVRDTISEVGGTSLKDMGRVMKTLMPKVTGRAEGGVVSQVVKQMLSD